MGWPKVSQEPNRTKQLFLSTLIVESLHNYNMQNLFHDDNDSYFVLHFSVMERKVDNNPGEPMKVSSQGTIKVHAIRDIMDKVGKVSPLYQFSSLCSNLTLEL